MYELVLPFRTPFDWEAMLGFLRARAVLGVEEVDDPRYRAVVRLGRRVGTIEIRLAGERNALVASVGFPSRTGREVERRLRAMFDLDLDPEPVRRVLTRSPILRESWRRHPGIRVPGAWDAFEILVRAIVGQQVSVAGARTILGRIAAKVSTGEQLTFPGADELAAVDLRGLGMPDRRAENLRRAAAAVTDGRVRLEGGEESRRQLLALPGVGPWTVEYVAMRAFRDPDAFPEGDLVLRRAASKRSELSAAELLAAAEAWRPWRAYAAMLLWASAPKAGQRRSSGEAKPGRGRR